MDTPVRSLTDAAIASHLLLVRLARLIWVKIDKFIAILCTATEPTPPAPITKTLLICYALRQRFVMATAYRGL